MSPNSKLGKKRWGTDKRFPVCWIKKVFISVNSSSEFYGLCIKTSPRFVELLNRQNSSDDQVSLSANTSNQDVYKWEICTINRITVDLPQHVGKRRIWLSPISSALVVAVYKADSGKKSHVWLSGIQKRASWNKEHWSTKHLVQLEGKLIFPSSAKGKCFVHVPQPAWATIMIPVLLEESFFQLGQPITPKTISPSTTRAKPT